MLILHRITKKLLYMIRRSILDIIKKQLFKSKVILVFGARRVGKTYLCKEIIKEMGGTYYNCELSQVYEALNSSNQNDLFQLLKDQKLVVFDEAQTVPKIGIKLKVMVDHFPNVQIIATGSSAFELRDATSEPLTGRSRTYILHPFSMEEVATNSSLFEAQTHLDTILRFGLYPQVFKQSDMEMREELFDISSNYLYKDILHFGQVKKPELIQEILKLLALQIGNEVSLNELSKITQTSIHTIKRYINLLEQTYVITSLKSYSTNARKELGKSKKYYFNDLGIRNAIINNFNPLSLRNDVGNLWENFCIIERIKYNNNNRNFINPYFWRNYDQQEIDLIEESGGSIKAFEFKYKENQKTKIPNAFVKLYGNVEFKKINKQNYMSFVTSIV